MNPKLRTTFGIINPETHKRYNDIIYSLIVHDTFTNDIIKYESMFYRHAQRVYMLDIDTDLKNKLQHNKKVDVIISLQQRMGLNIAVARAPSRPTKGNKQTAGEWYAD